MSQTQRTSPVTRKDDLVEVLHGVSVPDPYRWLEDGESTETHDWVEAQNARTRGFLAELPQAAAIRARLDELFTVGWVSTPVLRGNRSFYQRRDGRLDQPVLVSRDGPDGQERTILDPNGLSAKGIVALDWWYPSDDGRLLAFGLSEGGTELSTLSVLDVDRGVRLESDQIPYTRAASIAWLPDNSGFYYTRYPTLGSVPDGEEMYHRHVFFHSLGADWRQDAEVFGAGRAREDWPNVDISSSGRWLSVEVEQGWSRSEVYVLDRENLSGGFIAIHEGIDAMAHAVFAGDRLLVHTNRDAPNWVLFEVDPSHPDRSSWRLIIPERADRVLDAIHPSVGRLIAHELHNATSEVRMYDLEGAVHAEVQLPGLGTVTGLGGEWSGSQMTLGFTSFAQPPTAYTVDVASGSCELLAHGELPPGFDATNYTVRQDWYTSRDGTRVSIFVISRRDVPLDSGPRPTLLTGYGGFNVSRTPMFVTALPLWLDAGGVYALPNLRGGGEYGEAWHRAGMLGSKQNVFDDFIAAGEWLVSQGITSPDLLAISGGSNGGLLVGAALTQRPDLFRAVVCQVPLLDMLRYQNLRIARLWIAEYGSAEDPSQFEWLYAYSPYHRVRDGERYPATFLLTADGDSRVDPMHARKMAARLQAATAGDAPVLLRVESAAGHGQGKPRSKLVDEATDIWSFLFSELGVTAPTIQSST
ncbi:MAG: S9 family peptidase [Chloroflexi bacterium]|nr:S9 family peptidase [Chloroflexota bacterium]MBV9134208.1 S9 family peptidase [Chloroflexota bacterium]MBV9892828.1 S9 family peptidase [Chloroflexota bacterium]